MKGSCLLPVFAKSAPIFYPKCLPGVYSAVPSAIPFLSFEGLHQRSSVSPEHYTIMQRQSDFF